MDRKTKINVLLPMKMVGELENLSKLGKRSKFIQSAIRNKLDAREEYNVADIPTKQLLVMLINREENETVKELLMIVRRLQA